MTATEGLDQLPAAQLPVGQSPAAQLTVDQSPVDQLPVDHDFDEAWRERKAARVAPRIRLLGKVYTLPPSLPAKLILFAVNARRTGRSAADQVDAEEAFDMLAALLGEGNLVDLLERGLEVDDLPDLLATCQRLYQERQSGNGAAPATGRP